MHHHQCCTFCSIAAGQLPAYVVYENERIMAFLDINPIRPGHTQIIPKMHFPYFDDLSAELLGEIMTISQRLAQRMKSIYRVERVGVAFTGSDVPHVHAHVIPLHASDDLTSRRYIIEKQVTYRDPPPLPDDEMAATASLLKEVFQ